MGKRRKSNGFNTPFTGLTVPATPARAAAPAPAPVAAPPSTESDAELFAAAVRDATPLAKARGRVEPAKREAACLPDDEQLALLELHSLIEGRGPFETTDAEEICAGRAPGVSIELVERLQQGHFSWRRHLDLHGLTREEAKAQLTRFIVEARREGERCVLVVTGRGLGSPDGVAVLRQALPRWLGRAPLRAHVLAYTLARQVDGGAGAFYVLLRRPGVRPFGGP